MIPRLNRVNHVLMNICGIAAVICMLGIVGSLVTGVVLRFAFNTPLIGGDDFASISMVWLTMICAPLGLHLSEHVSLSFIVDTLPAQFSKLLKVFLLAVVLFVCLSILYYSGPFLKGGFSQTIPSIQWMSRGVAYIAIPVGFLLTAWVAFLQIINVIFSFNPPKQKSFWAESQNDDLGEML